MGRMSLWVFVWGNPSVLSKVSVISVLQMSVYGVLVAELVWWWWASCNYVRHYPALGTISRFLRGGKSCRVYWLPVNWGTD